MLSFLFIASVTALYSTKGFTFQAIIFCLLIIWILLNNKACKSIRKVKNFRYKAFFKVFFPTNIIAYSLFFFIYTDSDFPSYLNPDWDFVFYAKLSTALIKFGIENPKILGANYYTVPGLSLYHYTDLWFNGLISKLLNGSEIRTLLFVTYPILLCTTIYSIAGILHKTSKRKLHTSIIISFILLYGSNTFPMIFSDNQMHTWGHLGLPGLIYISTKTLIIYPLLIIAFKYISDNNLIQGLIFLALTIVSYPTIIPAFAGGASILMLYHLISQDKIISKHSMLNIILPSIFFLLIIATLFFIVHYSGGYFHSLSINKYSYKANLIIVAKYFIEPWLIYWLTSLLLILTFKKQQIIHNNKQIFFFILASLITASIFVGLTHESSNAHQALYNSTSPLFSVFTIFLYTWLYKKINPTFNKVIMVLSVIIFAYNLGYAHLYHSNRIKDAKINLLHDKAFTNSIATKIKSLTKPPRIASITSSAYLVMGHLNYFNGNFILYNKNTSLLFELSGFANADYLKILNKYNINYVYIEKDQSIPAQIKPYLKQIARDNKTGDLFYNYTPSR